MSPARTNQPQIEMAAHGSLKPNPNNPRTHSPKQIEQLVQSLRRFGFKGAIIVDQDTGLILAGHALWLAAGKLKLEEVPVIRASFATEADRRAFALAHNRLAELSGWDDELLAEELNFLFADGYDLEITGFSTADLDFAVAEPPDDNDAVELPDANTTAVSQLGDLWHIGPHRLYNGDARLAESYEALLGDERADMVFSDPPYGVKIQGHVSGLGKARHSEFAMMSGEQTPAELTAFLRAVFRNCVRFTRAASIHYQCMDWRHIREMLDAADGVYTEFKQLVVWNKGVGGMGTFYRSQHELIFVFKAGLGKHVNSFSLGETGRYRTNVWDVPGCNTFSKDRAEDLAAHPTVKPPALVMDAILDCSNRGDLILDPFSGSGTTLTSAHRTNRRGAAIEIDPLYCDLTIRRLCKASGLTAVHADGRGFEEVAAARAAEEVLDG